MEDTDALQKVNMGSRPSMPTAQSDARQESAESSKKYEKGQNENELKGDENENEKEQEEQQQQEQGNHKPEDTFSVLQGIGAARALCQAPDGGRLYVGDFDGRVTAIGNPAEAEAEAESKRETILKVPARVFTVAVGLHAHAASRASSPLLPGASSTSTAVAADDHTTTTTSLAQTVISGVSDGSIYLSSAPKPATGQPARKAGGGAAAYPAPPLSRQITRLVGHGTAAVRAAAAAAKRKIFATAGVSGLLRWWHLPGGEPISGCVGHSDDINGLAFSPSQTWLATASSDSTVKIWEVGADSVGAALPAAKPSAIFTGHQAIVVAVIAANDTTAVSAGCDKLIRVWNKDTLRVSLVLRGHEGNITSLAMSAANGTNSTAVLASGSMDRTVRLWSFPGGEALSVLRNHANFVYTLAFAADGATLTSAGEGGNIRYWSVPEGNLLHTTNAAHGGEPIRALSAGPEGIVLSGGFDRKLQAWDVGSKECIASAENAHNGRIFALAATCAATNPVGGGHNALLISGAADGSIRTWDCFGAVCNDDGDETDEQEQQSLARCKLSAAKHIVGHGQAAVRAIAVASNSNLFATAGVSGLLLWWEWPRGEPVGSCSGHSCDINGLTFSPSEAWLASAGSDGTIKVWDLPVQGAAPEYKPRAVLRGHEGIVVVVIAPDDDTIVSGSCDRTIRVWDPEKNSVLRTMRGHAANVTSLAMSSGNDVLASGSMDKTIRLWNFQDGTTLCVLEGHSKFIYNVIFATNAIFSAGEDGIFMWPEEFVAATKAAYAEAMRAVEEARLREEEAERQRAVALAQRLKEEEEVAKQKLARYQRRQAKIKERKGDFKWTFPDAESAEVTLDGDSSRAPAAAAAATAAAAVVVVRAGAGNGVAGGTNVSAGGKDDCDAGVVSPPREVKALGTSSANKKSVFEKLRLAVPRSRRHANQPEPPTVRSITIINAAFDKSVY